MAVWALTSGELRHPVGQAFIFGGRGENWRLGLGEAGGFKYFFSIPCPIPSVSRALQLWLVQFFKEDGGQLPSPSPVKQFFKC